jgi:hypothetical protein
MTNFTSSSVMVSLLESHGFLSPQEADSMCMLPTEYIEKMLANEVNHALDVSRDWYKSMLINLKAMENGVAFEDTAFPTLIAEADALGLIKPAEDRSFGSIEFEHLIVKNGEAVLSAEWYKKYRIPDKSFETSAILTNKLWKFPLFTEKQRSNIRVLDGLYFSLLQRAPSVQVEHNDSWDEVAAVFYNFMRNTDSVHTMVKVYFACSIMGGGDTSQYLAIIQALKASGADVISEVFAHDAINLGGSPLPAEEIYQRDIDMINEADIVVAELSNPSLGVGYELGYAQATNKPILGLYNTDAPKKLSAMISGNPYITVANYSSGNVPTDAIRKFIVKNPCV